MLITSQSKKDLNEIVERYKQLIYGIALSYTKNKTDADDVFQEVFLTYIKKEPIFNDEEHRKAWLINTAVNCSKKAVFNPWKKRISEIDETIPDDKNKFFETEEQNIIFSVLSSLPQKYRIVLHLFYFEDMSISNIARNLGIKEGTVKVQLNRGREMMRERLKGDYFDE